MYASDLIRILQNEVGDKGDMEVTVDIDGLCRPISGYEVISDDFGNELIIQGVVW